MAYNLDREKYKKVLDSMYGAGAYNSGLSNAREIGKLQGQAEIGKANFNKALSDRMNALDETYESTKQDTVDDLVDSNLKKYIKDRLESGAGYPSQEEMDAYVSDQTTKYNHPRDYALNKPTLQEDIGIADLKKEMDKNKAAKKKKKEPSKTDKLLNFFKNIGKDTDGNGRAEGLDFLDKTLGRASRSAQKAVLGEDFIKKQDDNYKKLAKDTNDTQSKAAIETKSKKAETGLEKASDIAGSIIGEIAPYTVGYGAADKVLKVAKGLNKIKNPILREAVRGSIAGGAVGTGKAIARDTFSYDYGAKDYAKQIGVEAALGGGTDAAISGVFRLASRLKGAKNAKNVTNNETAATAEKPVTERPTTQNANTVTNPIDVPDAPSPSQYDVDFNKAVDDQYEYLKNSMGKGVQPGGLVRDREGYVTGAYGRVSNNPKWYQDFYQANNRKPNNTELRELASQQVKNGFSDEVGSIPAWKPKAVQEIDDQIDELNTLLAEAPDQTPAIKPILEALNEDRADILQRLKTPLKQGNSEPYEAISAMRDGGSLKRVDSTPEIDQTVGDASSFNAKVNRTKQKKQSGTLSSLRTQFIDDLAPLEDLEKKITGGVASAENSLYKQARLFKGSPEKANQIVKEQLYPIINDIQKKGISTNDLGDYALAVHAKDVNSKGINSGFTNAEIDDVINKLGSPEMEVARKQLLGVNNEVLRMLSTGDSPVISQESVDAMKTKWPNYMSLFRAFDDDKIEFSNGLSKALTNGSSPIKKLEGSSREVIDPMESMIKNIYKATTSADKNNVVSKLGVLAKQDTEGNFIRKLPDNEDTGRLNVISAMENGKKVKYEVPPDVYRAMMNLDKESSNTLIKILQKPASTLRAGATLTPEFSLRNPLRDVPQAFIVSKSGFNPLVDFPVGLWQSIWKGRKIKIGNKEFDTSGELYKQFLKENGGYGNIVSMDRKLHQETLKKVLTEANNHYVDVLSPTTFKSLLKSLSNPLNALRNIADVSESATKVGEYRAALRSGQSTQEAAYRARDIMDFARAGVSVREANKVVAFLNANIQGKSKLYRAFKENPSKVIGKSIASVTLPTIGTIVAQNTMSNERQREILDDAPQYLKDTFYLVPIPGTNQIARIPKPFDLAFAFSNSLERAADFALKNDKNAFDGFIKQGFSAMSVPTMLTGVAPIVEGMANYSFFRQGPIIPQREQNMDYPDQYDVNSSEVSKFVGKQINNLTGGNGALKNFGSPRVIDNTIQGFTGGLGTYATNIVDLILDGTNLTDNPEKPAKGIDQKPIIKAFLVNQSGSGASIDKLYTMKDKLNKAKSSANQNDSRFDDATRLKTINDAAKQISELNKEIRSIENSYDYNADEKRNLLNDLVQQRNQIARQTLKYVE